MQQFQRRIIWTVEVLEEEGGTVYGIQRDVISAFDVCLTISDKKGIIEVGESPFYENKRFLLRPDLFKCFGVDFELRKNSRSDGALNGRFENTLSRYIR